MSLFDVDENQKNTINNKAEQKNEQKKNIKSEEVTEIKSKKQKSIETEETPDNKKLRVLIENNDLFPVVESKIFEQFERKKMHHAIMLSGNYGIGKATFAYYLISKMILHNCDANSSEMHIDLLKKNIHPDVMFLELINDENEIKIEQIRAFLEKIVFKSTYGNKFVIIDDINSINLNGINALLKIIEEPPENTFFFIINHKVSHVLDTIKSRCNEMNMSISRQDFIKVLQKIHNISSIEDIEFYADVTDNSISFTKILYDIELKKIILNEEGFLKKDLHKILNEVYKQIDFKYKSLSYMLKMSLLERIIIYCVNKNIKDNLIKSNNLNNESESKLFYHQNIGLLKQFANIKLLELPVKFI